MRHSFFSLLTLAMMLALPGAALAQPMPDQTPPPAAAKPATAPKPDQPPPPARPEGQGVTLAPARRPGPGQPVNVRIEFTINDQLGTAAPAQKTISLILADRQEGMIRSEGIMPGYGSVQLNVDAEVSILTQGPQPGFENKIFARLGLSYDLIDPKASSSERQSRTTQIRESLTVLLESGKPMVLSQSADPITDRKVTVEVKATIVK
jgi:hypothetical protein